MQVPQYSFIVNKTLSYIWPFHPSAMEKCQAGQLFSHTIPGEGVLIYFSVGEGAAEQSIIFRIPTPGQGIIFVKIGSMAGSIFVIFDSERSF